MNSKTDGFHTRLLGLDDGAYDVIFESRRYLLRKESRLNNKLIKLFAEELGGNNFISLNYYPTLQNGLLKPCEMAPEKVIAFILGMKLA